MTRLARPRRATRTEPIIALVDVVFFLLVFALLIGRMDATAPFEVTPPIAVTGDDLPGGAAILAIAGDGVMALDNAVVARDAMLADLSARLSRDPTLRISLNADAALEMRHILPLLEDLRAIGATDVVVIATPADGG